MSKAHRENEYAGSKTIQYINLHAGNVANLPCFIQRNAFHSQNSSQNTNKLKSPFPPQKV